MWAEGVNGDFTFGAKREREWNSHWTATPYEDPWAHLHERQKQTLILDLSPILCSLLIQYYLRKSKSYLFCNSQVRVPINTEIPFFLPFLFVSTIQLSRLAFVYIILWRSGFGFASASPLEDPSASLSGNLKNFQLYSPWSTLNYWNCQLVESF